MRKILFVLLFSLCYLWSAAQIEKGEASIVADKFVGKKTASGEPYNPDVFTAAHKTFPLGTQVLVTNPQTGKSVIVKINDRGPFVDGRIIDLSKSAAENIGITTAMGVATVEIQSLDGSGVVSSTTTTTTPSTTTTTTATTPSTTTTTPSTSTTITKAPTEVVSETVILPSDGGSSTTSTASSSSTSSSTTSSPTTGGFVDNPTRIINSKTIGANFAVQLGSFRDLNNLNIQLASFKSHSFGHELNIYETWKGGKKLYKILVGPYQTRTEAESKKRLIKENYQLDSFVFSVK